MVFGLCDAAVLGVTASAPRRSSGLLDTASHDPHMEHDHGLGAYACLEQGRSQQRHHELDPSKQVTQPRIITAFLDSMERQ